MSKTAINENLLIKVIQDLSDFLPCLVLVGGWVPYIYAKYVWKDISQFAVSTSDIDFGVYIRPLGTDETIAQRVRKAGYGERHVSMDRMIPFVPIVKGNQSNQKAEVEFIVDPKFSKEIKERIIGNEIKVNEIEHFGILLDSVNTVSIKKQYVQIPVESIFIFHKLLTFIKRENRDKLRKDLYYVYYMLRFCPNREMLISDVKKLFKTKREGEEVISNVKTYFGNEDSEGPIYIELENGPDYFVSSVRNDSYKRIIQLID